MYRINYINKLKIIKTLTRKDELETNQSKFKIGFLTYKINYIH